MTALVIVGCGGFGREVNDVVDAVNAARTGGEPIWKLLGYVDDAPSPENLERIRRRGVDVLGGLDRLRSMPPEVAYVIGIGSPAVKARLDAALGSRPAAVLVHPEASTGYDVRLGPGTVICAGSRLTTDIRLGRHVHVGVLCSIGHDVVIGDHASINPLVAVSGSVDVGPRVMLGAHSAVLQTLTVGADATVGGAALVTKDVPEASTVKGVPAR